MWRFRLCPSYAWLGVASITRSPHGPRGQLQLQSSCLHSSQKESTLQKMKEGGRAHLLLLMLFPVMEVAHDVATHIPLARIGPDSCVPSSNLRVPLLRKEHIWWVLLRAGTLSLP